MQIVYIGAGLANRMFQYSFALSLKAKGYDVRIDEHSFIPRYDFEKLNLRDVFENIEIPESDVNSFKDVIKNGKCIKLYRKLSEYFPDYRYIERWNLNYDDSIYKKTTRNCAFVGFWISYKYFQDVKNDVLNAFRFREFEKTKNKEILFDIENSESVAVHFRKNVDYIKNVPWTCPPEYYYNSINAIKSRLKNPKFFFFSDNWNWVKENIKGVEYIPVDWNPSYGPNSYCDMQLMSRCKHNIIANSTYSWWGAYLNNNERKIICAPNDWFGKMLKNINDVIPNDWLLEERDF